MWYKVHTKDEPDWALWEEDLPRSYLDFMSEPTIEIGDDRGPISEEDAFLRCQFEAAMHGHITPLKWLLKRIAREQAAELRASQKRASVAVRGIPRLAPLAPALVALGCISVIEAESGSNNPPQIRFAPWFEEALRDHIREEKLALVNEWLAQGGYQKPRIPDSDRLG